MAEPRQDKTNGIGKTAAAGKKRRKGQDLQPIQTPPQQNGFRNNYAGLAPNYSLDLHSRYALDLNCEPAETGQLPQYGFTNLAA